MRIYNEDITREELLKKQCCICGDKNKNKLFHHLIPRNKQNNGLGVVLCYSCHRGIHWLYHNFDNAEKIYKKYLEFKEA